MGARLARVRAPGQDPRPAGLRRPVPALRRAAGGRGRARLRQRRAGQPLGETARPAIKLNHGRTQAKDLQVPPRQAARDAWHISAGADAVPAVPPPGAAAPRLRQLRPLPWPRGRAADGSRSGRLTMAAVAIALDAMGGDRGPAELVEGAVEAASDDVNVL